MTWKPLWRVVDVSIKSRTKFSNHLRFLVMEETI